MEPVRLRLGLASIYQKREDRLICKSKRMKIKMKTRTVLSFIVALTVLILVGCSQLPTQIVPPAQDPIAGQETSHRGRLRLFSDPQGRELAYTILGGRVFDETVTGDILLSFSGRRVYAGPSPVSPPVYTIRGDRMFEGPNITGDLAYTFRRVGDKTRVFEGSVTGNILYTIWRNRMFEGPNTTGDIVFHASDDLTGNVKFILPILAQIRQ